MKNQHLTLFLLFNFFTISLYSQGSLEGMIKINQTDIPVSDVYIFLEGTNYFDISRTDGKFFIEDIPDGKYILRTSAIGFHDIGQEVEFISNSKKQIELNIEEAIIDLPIIEVNAQSGTGGYLGSLSLPGSSHYISKKEMFIQNSGNIHDILQVIPGVQLQEEEGFGLRPNIGLRGTGSERSSKITIMEDGVLAAPAPYSAPSAYYFPNVIRMDAIEVMKGASQIKYGPFTTGGVINFISTPIPKSLEGSLNMGIGSFGLRHINASFGDRKGQFSYLIQGNQTQTNGFKEIQGSDSSTGFDKKDWLVKLKWSSKPESKIYQSLLLKAAESYETSDETYLGLTRSDFEQDPFIRYSASQMDQMNFKHRQLSLNYLISPAKNLHIQSTLYQNNFQRNWYKLDKVYNVDGRKSSISNILNDPVLFNEEYNLLLGRESMGNSSLDVKANNRVYISRGLQSKANYSFNNHRFELGIRAHYDEMDRFQWVDNYSMNSKTMELNQAGEPGTESNRIESATALASHFLYNYNYQKFEFQLGLRNERINFLRRDYGNLDPQRNGENISSRENEVNAFLPGASVIYKINDHNQLFSGIHRGFSPPGSRSETLPEFSINYELGYRIQKNAFFGSLVLFRNNFSNLLGADLASSGGTGEGELYNGGASIAQGIEVAGSYAHQISGNWSIPIQFQYSFTDAFFQTSFESEFEPWGMVSAGDQLPYLSRNNFSLLTGLKSKRLQFNYNLNYMGAMRIQPGDGETPNAELIGSRLIMNFSIQYRITRRSSIQFLAQNLTNRTYVVANRPAGWRPGMPRNFGIMLRNNF